MKILVLYTLLPDELAAGRVSGEFDLTEAAEEVLRVLPGVEMVGVRGSVPEISEILQSRRPDVVFNLCEAPLGRPELESQVAALFERQGVRFTGSGSRSLELCRRKDWTKAALVAAGILVPRAGVFPCIVKPADQDGSAGIGRASVCDDLSELEQECARIAGPVLVEEFLPGKEFAISLWGLSAPEYFSIGEAYFADGLKLFTYDAKWDLESADYKNSLLHYDTHIEPALRNALITTARRAWRAVGAGGYLRLDIRLDKFGVPRVLDVNPNPEITPGLGTHRAVEEVGWTWDRFVQQQVSRAASSAGIGPRSKNHRGSRCRSVEHSQV